MSFALRHLFATIFLSCQPSDPHAIRLKYYRALSEDFRRKFPNCVEKVKCLIARSVEQFVEAMGKSLKSFGLEHIVEVEDEELRRARAIVDVMDASISQECIECRGNLNTAQQQAVDVIINHVKQGKPGAFFIDGLGGTRKTFLYKALYVEVRFMNLIVLATATSGIAALNIPSRRTAHSKFKIPIDSDASLACDVPKRSSLAALIRATT